MGKQARWRTPWVAGIAGAVLLGGLATVRVLIGRGERAASTGAPAVPTQPDGGGGKAVSEREPNDEARTATPMIRIGGAEASRDDRWASTVNRYFASGHLDGADADCHALPLEVPASGAVVRIVARADPAVALTLEIVSETAPLLSVRGAAGRALVVPALGARAWVDTYQLCLGATGAAAAYRVEVETLAPRQPFEFEPNDTRELASALPAGVWLEGTLPPGDHDWYRIGASGEAATVRFAGIADTTAQLVTTDDAGRELATMTAIGAVEVRLPGALPVFVHVRAATGDGDDRRYRLMLEVGGAP